MTGGFHAQRIDVEPGADPVFHNHPERRIGSGVLEADQVFERGAGFDKLRFLPASDEGLFVVGIKGSPVSLAFRVFEKRIQPRDAQGVRIDMRRHAMLAAEFSHARHLYLHGKIDTLLRCKVTKLEGVHIPGRLIVGKARSEHIQQRVKCDRHVRTFGDYRALVATGYRICVIKTAA